MDLELDKHILMKQINLLAKLIFILKADQTIPLLHHSLSLDVHVIMTLKIFSNQHTVIEQVDHIGEP